MSDSDNPEREALEELETLVRRVTDQADHWRRRALRAEADRAALGEDHDAVGARQRILELERRNAELTARLETARERVEHLARRLRFLEEQVAIEESAG